jgi:two-component system NarL family sensor kinase
VTASKRDAFGTSIGGGSWGWTSWACLALVVGALSGLVLAPEGRVDTPIAMVAALAVGFSPTGLFIVRARPRQLVGRIMTVVGLLALVALVCAAWSSLDAAAWATQWTWWPPLALVPLALLAHPDGRLKDRRRGHLAAVIGVSALVATVGLAAAALSAPRTLLTAGAQAPDAARPALLAAAAGAGILLVATGAVVIDMIVRARNADGVTRSQIVCLLPVGLLLIAGVALDVAGVPFATVPGIVALPVGMGVAILRHRLDDLDLLVNRSLVWVLMSAAILAAFAGTVAVLSATTLAGRPVIASAVGTGIVAAGFDPVRRWVQRSVDRILFGDRSRPQTVLVRLGQRMQLASEPGAMLADFVTTLGTALLVPFVRMLVEAPDGRVLKMVEDGRPQDGLLSLPMVANGERVGHLQVAPRRSGEKFTKGERELLQDVSGQAAIAARSFRMTLELQRAREVLVRGREEERLRLRRDLHDGLGPALAGTRMQLVAARGRVNDPDARGMIEVSLEVLAECTGEVRRLVDGLRPPALDQGLERAVRHRADALLAGVESEVVVDGELDELSAAVEVAAYRIVTEALTNVVKHAGASRVSVRLLRRNAVFEAVVTDNGRGEVALRPGGVGLESMALRAEELGGSLEVSNSPTGTTVHARLPL